VVSLWIVYRFMGLKVCGIAPGMSRGPPSTYLLQQGATWKKFFYFL
jgi:hypothetical protein